MRNSRTRGKRARFTPYLFLFLWQILWLTQTPPFNNLHLRNFHIPLSPTETWQPAAVTDATWQNWQSEVNDYSETLSHILERSGNDKMKK